MPTLNSITSAFVGRRPHITKSRLARAQTKKSEIDDGGWTITLDNAKTPRSEMTGYGKNLMQQRQALKLGPHPPAVQRDSHARSRRSTTTTPADDATVVCADTCTTRKFGRSALSVLFPRNFFG